MDYLAPRTRHWDVFLILGPDKRDSSQVQKASFREADFTGRAKGAIDHQEQ